MLKTIIRIEWLNLKRDRVALAIVFVLPLLFFSVFAMIFGGMSSGGDLEANPMKVIVVDNDASNISKSLVQELQQTAGLDVNIDSNDDDRHIEPWTIEAATERVRKGQAAAVIVIPADFGITFASFGQDRPAIEVIYDPADFTAEFAISGMLQGVAMKAAPDALMQQGYNALDEFAGGLTEQQRAFMDEIRPFMRGEQPWDDFRRGQTADADPDAANDVGATPSSSTAEGFDGLVRINSINVRSLDENSDAAESTQPSPMPYYAAGIGVMFLLFSMVGAAGSILKEEETGSLERLLTSNMTVTQLLAGKWLFFAIVGAVQVIMMFAFGELVYGGMNLWNVHHIVGLLVITLFTAGAAASFGIMMASLCRTRGQLDGTATIVILIMSAVGGSMVPRMFMPDFMRSLGSFTFNGQAIDGFLAVFWEGRTTDSLGTMLISILPSVAAMIGMAIAFFVIARLLARRWETA
ncbi:MAG: ABC transporter permease [Phycisphaerales bacterium]